MQSKNPNPEAMSGFALIQLLFPGAARVSSGQLGTLIQRPAGQIRKAIFNNEFGIPFHKDSDSPNAHLWFDVRDVAAYLDKKRNPVRRGRPTKASKLAEMEGGGHA